MLAVAYGKAVGPSVLGNIRRASRAWGQGETALALIHLARSGLPRLPEGEDAPFRLFAADRLLAEGLAPRDLLKACSLDTGPLDLLKAGYNPDEPRVPAGNPDGGEWTNGDDTGTTTGSGSSGPPRGGPSSASGDGNETHPHTTLHGYATVYANSFAGRPTATGEIFDQNKMTAAVLPGTIPLRSMVTVTLDSDPRRSIQVYVNDHGLYRLVRNPDGSVSRRPFPGRVIDLSRAAFKALTGMAFGKVMVTVTLKSRPVK